MWELRCDFHVQRAELSALTGDHADADAHYMAADVIFLAHDRRRTHLCSAQGAWWADWLVRTGRCEAADVLLSHNKALSAAHGEHQNVARCDRVLATLSTCRGDLHEAYELLTAAMRTFRAGDYLVELAAVLADLAECARQTGLLELGERHAAEAIAIAAPRGLVAAESAGLAALARIQADRGLTSAPDGLAPCRATADVALRRAVEHRLAWCELDALRAHSYIDQLTRADNDWSARAESLHSRLVPAGLEPDPLSAADRQLAEERRSGSPWQ
jgi:hypothetical protein